MTRYTEEEYQALLHRQKGKDRQPKTGFEAVTEAQLQDQTRQAALWTGWSFYHTHDSRKSDEDFPDCIMLRPPRWLVVELKKEGQSPTPGQNLWLELFKRCGAETYVWRPSDIYRIMEILR